MGKKLVVFDFGGVLLNDEPGSGYSYMDFQNGIDSILCSKEEGGIYKGGIYKSMYREERHKLWTLEGMALDGLIAGYAKAFGHGITVEGFKEAYVKCFSKIPWFDETLGLLRQITLRDDADTAILSNLSEIDGRILDKKLESLGIGGKVLKFYSFNLGCHKPNDRIYSIVEQVSGRKPGDILFVDNYYLNTMMAGSRGWETCTATGYGITEIKEKCKEFIKSTTHPLKGMGL